MKINKDLLFNRRYIEDSRKLRRLITEVHYTELKALWESLKEKIMYYKRKERI